MFKLYQTKWYNLKVMNSLKFKKNILIFILFFYFFNQEQITSAQSVSNFNFYRNLSLGDSGNDVLQLQKILNQDTETRIAISGIGSVGNETNYFGNLTKNALIKFQNKYRDGILTPVGLVYGTGFFGQNTINFIENGLYQHDQIQNIENVENVENTSENKPIIKNEIDNASQPQNNLSVSDSIEIYFISQRVFESGDELTVVGTGINKDSEIYFFNFDNDKIINAKIESNFMFFDAPNLPNGEYEVYIKNDNLISKPFVVKIVDDYNPPKISSISPSTISYGDTVIIKGNNFEEENTVITSLGTYSAVSNGSEIKLYIQKPNNLNTNQVVVPSTEEFEGLIQVQNTNGISDAKLVDFIYN